MTLDDKSKFEGLYARHYEAVYRYAYRRVANREEAADVVADVFTAAWRHLKDVPDESSELVWLYKVAHRSVLHSERSSRRLWRLRTRLTQEEAGTRGMSCPSSDASLDALRTAVSQLPPRDRELIGLVMWEGLGHTEAGSVLGCTANAVTVRLHKIKRRLREQLSDSNKPVAFQKAMTE
jgi:RNA polymerase sigma-70 factor, ECF subfamily